MANTQSVSEVRTQIYLPRDIHRAIKKQAYARGVSMAKVIRDAVEEKIPVTKTKKKADKQWKELMKFAGIAKGTSNDDSARTGDLWAEIIYENMKKNRKRV